MLELGEMTGWVKLRWVKLNRVDCHAAAIGKQVTRKVISYQGNKQ